MSTQTGRTLVDEAEEEMEVWVIVEPAGVKSALAGSSSDTSLCVKADHGGVVLTLAQPTGRNTTIQTGLLLHKHSHRFKPAVQLQNTEEGRWSKPKPPTQANTYLCYFSWTKYILSLLSPLSQICFPSFPKEPHSPPLSCPCEGTTPRSQIPQSYLT